MCMQPQVDHKDRARTLDNRKSNLRIATSTQNACNRTVRRESATGVKGVHQDKRYGTYRVQVCVNAKRRYLGTFKSLEEAAIVARNAREDMHGEFARNV